MKLLFINACVRDEASRTLQLANRYLELESKKMDLEITERNLSQESLVSLRNRDFDEFGECTYPYELELAEEFTEADYIVIAAPLWEFEFPAILNVYLEMVSKVGITFEYTTTGSCGLCSGKRLTYIYTAGGFLRNEEKIGEMKLRQLSKLYGIDEFQVIYADGLDVNLEKTNEILSEILNKIK